MLLLGSGTAAAPGAHGPDGEHLDAPAQATGGGSDAPRIEARSETFELVGHLRADEFSILINRFETNEPVLEAKVEVETAGLKAAARFHSDMGDYAVDDAAFLTALRAAGEHALVITVFAGTDTDLLDGTLKSVGAAAGARGHSHDDEQDNGLPATAWILLALLVLGVFIFFLNRRPGTTAGAAP
ncbi:MULTISPECIES: hypothetical protein [unclassified Variovorax]|uniref:hypothetical protein n=1 Tax=unclassified Variovorax TaxID=663243 RepID=UPI001E2CAFC6|nr:MULTISPECIES: hypothetical protein [unclassified Variovorax]